MSDAKMQMVKVALGKHALDNLGRTGPEGTAAAQAIKDRLRAMLLNDVAVSNLYTSDGEPVRSAAQLAASFGADGRYEQYDQVRVGLLEWLDCDMRLGEELLEIVECHVGEITDDEGEREDIGRLLVDEAVVYAIRLTEQWTSDEAVAAEADRYVAGMRDAVQAPRPMGAGFTAQPFIDRAPAWLLERDSYARVIFQEACLRSAEAFSGGHGRLPDAARDLREWWETFVDYLLVAADSTLDGAETDAEREDAKVVQRLAEHFQAGFAAEFPAVSEPAPIVMER